MKKTILSCALMACATSNVFANETAQIEKPAQSDLFFTASGGYIWEIERPYALIKLGTEIGDRGNLFLQLMHIHSSNSTNFAGVDVGATADWVIYGAGYTHYFPVNEEAAFFAAASLGGAYLDVDLTVDNSNAGDISGTSFYADLSLGFEQRLSDHWILHVAGRGLHMEGFTDENVKITYTKDVFFGLEAGLTFLF